MLCDWLIEKNVIIKAAQGDHCLPFHSRNPIASCFLAGSKVKDTLLASGKKDKDYNSFTVSVKACVFLRVVLPQLGFQGRL